MQFLVRSILEHNLLEGAKLVAGEQGINNRILWVNVMEILDTPDSLQKGELLITTGFGLEDEERHKGLIKRLKDWGLSGIAIQPGYYIDTIPPYVLRDADECGLPVLELGKSLTFSHMMHVLFEHISMRADYYLDPDLSALRARIAAWNGQGGPIAGMWEDALDKTVHLLLVSESGAGTVNAFLQSLERLRQFLLASCSALHTEAAGNKALLFFTLRPNVALHDMLFHISALLPASAKQERLNLLIGLGTATRAPELTAALDEAAECAERLRKAGVLRGVCSLAGSSLFELLEHLQQNNSRALLLAHDALRTLSESDRLHGTEYIRTLRIYLAREGNSAEAANRLFIHRHTLKNRLEKIEQIGGVTLREYYARLHLSLALLISDCYSP